MLSKVSCLSTGSNRRQGRCTLYNKPLWYHWKKPPGLAILHNIQKLSTYNLGMPRNLGYAGTKDMMLRQVRTMK